MTNFTHKKKSKDLIFICGNLYPFDVGGTEIFNYYLMLSLSRFLNVYCMSQYKRPKIYENIGFIKIPNIKPAGIFFSLFAFIKIISLKSKHPTLILTYSRSKWINWWPYPLLRQLFDINYIIIIHGGGLSKWIFKTPHKKLFKYAHEIIGISNRICEEYKLRTSKKVLYIPPLIPFNVQTKLKNESKMEINLLPDSLVFLYVGSLKKLKNPKTILEALSILGLSFLQEHNIYLFMIGDGPLKEELINFTLDNKLSERVIIKGIIERTIVPLYYNASDYFIISSEYEGTPLSLLEALFNNLTVIGSDSPGINTIIQNGFNGYLFKTGDARNLAEIIAYSIKSESEETIRANAKRTFIEKYNYEVMLAQYLTILENNE